MEEFFFVNCVTIYDKFYLRNIFTLVYIILLLPVNILKTRPLAVLPHHFEAAEVLLSLKDFCIYNQFGNPAKLYYLYYIRLYLMNIYEIINK